MMPDWFNVLAVMVLISCLTGVISALCTTGARDYRLPMRLLLGFTGIPLVGFILLFAAMTLLGMGPK